MAKTYKVVRGDNLTKIAAKYGTTVSALVKLNNISNPDYIVVGQVLKISEDATSGGVSTNTKQSQAIVSVFGLQADTDRTVYAAWNWSKDNTEEYRVIWYYRTETDKIWFVGNDATTTDKQSVYGAPQNAVKVKFKVKPISKKRKVNNKETSYWTASWSTEKTYDFKDNPPEAPSAPKVEIENYNLTATLDNLDESIDKVQFQVVKDNSKIFKTGTAKVVTKHASFSCAVDVGSEYKVRCQAYKGKDASEWSDYSDNVSTKPAAPDNIATCKAKSETSVYLEWTSVKTADTYDIEYAKKRDYLDGSDQTSTKTGIEQNHYEIGGLESGEEYFFRVRAVNDKGESGWSGIKSIVIGKEPAAPTTWSSTTTVVIGEPLNLYWVHNSADESSQVKAELELTIDGDTEILTIVNSTDEDEKDKTSHHAIDTTNFAEGAAIRWRVRTCGITGVYGEWSIERTIDIYAPPTLELGVTNLNGELIDTLTAFPMHISASAGPNTQAPIGYHLTIAANEAYETVDHIGNPVHVNQGDTVYSKHFDIDEELLVDISAGDVNLDNNIEYRIECVVSMNSGLTATAEHNFTVAWGDLDDFEPSAEIGIDDESLVAYIRPYCEDRLDVKLSVYRRDFDGTFTEIAKDIDNVHNTFVTDPHPALDFARYRVVAVDQATGEVSFFDVPGYPVGEPGIVIQWDEQWTSFDTDNEDEMEEKPWAGSMLKLPYNVDISDKNDPDVSLVEYHGRSHPVGYYGTHIGSSSTWKTDVDKSDKETLYALRRLQRWMGDVYVREPSGSGYWAHVKVSFSQTHLKLVIPVTIDVTRVEGGM